MTQLCFYFDQTRCTGCFTCAVACKDWYDIDAGPVHWMRVRQMENGHFPNIFVAYLASPCYQCINPPCVLVCPVKAITKRDKDGIVTVDRQQCLGNKECHTLCLSVCPWNAPQFGPEKNAKMQKCEFCQERLEQGQQAVCVEACPMYALDIGPINEFQAKYGDEHEADGFSYSSKFKPAVAFKPKKR
jgi:anaerobic dimethyl sulfoxide reductase subunit B (iron-sulfur subunit)